MGWLALHFPHLPVEILDRGEEAPAPLAIWVTRSGARRILFVNPAARALGVAPGQSAAAALALAADLRLVARRPRNEQLALEGIARWALGFSPELSLAPPAALVLGIQRSLALFGGEQALLKGLLDGVAALGYQAHWGLAPTPAAALLLARQGGVAPVRELAALPAILGRVSLRDLDLAPEALERLWRMGARVVADLLRLPRSGLARRFGPELLLLLDRLLGRVPDPRPTFVPPAGFAASLELPAEVTAAPALLFAAQRLIRELCGMLLGQGAGAQRLDWELIHAEGPSTPLRLGLLTPTRDPDVLRELLGERLDRLTLPRPVRRIRLRVQEFLDLVPSSLGLWPDPRQPANGGERLLERLAARLGQDALASLECRADHRPERAWGWCAPGHGAGAGRARRPLWLLPEPLPLAVTDGQPCHRGERLVLERERERIEAGWWDGAGVARDYFIARTPAGERLWIFRDLAASGAWFLQGLFGPAG